MKINKQTIKAVGVLAGIAAVIGGAVIVSSLLEKKYSTAPVGAGQALSRAEVDAANNDRNDILNNSKPIIYRVLRQHLCL